MPRRTDDYRGLAEASRMRLLAEMQRHPGLLLRELAERTGLHENTVREHLAVLEREGLVARRTEHAGGRGRPPAVYHPVTDAAENPAAERRVRRAQEHGDLLRRIDAAPVCAAIGAAGMHQIDVLYEHLADAGLDPVLDEERLEVELVPCPQYRMLSEDQALVCGVHRRLIADVLAQVPGPLRLTVLEPYVEPDRCRVTLAAQAPD